MFFSKDTSATGTMTFQARGFSHGPQQPAMEQRERDGGYMLEGYFIMVETSQPLCLTPWADTLEDKDYLHSWPL